jgi:ATP/maltotriose-dependent transcriptional regulator MalT
MQDATDNPLTDKEIAVLRMVAQALSNSQIASRLGIAEATVKRHLHSVFVKLGAVSRIDAVNKAVAGSLISTRPEDAPARPASGTRRR